MAQQQQHMSTGFMLLRQHNALPCRCDADQFKVFVRGLEAVLQQWTALLLVTRHRDGEALVIIRDEIRDWFWEDGEVYSDELEAYFDDFFESVRYVVVEDGSTKEVSDVLHRMYVDCAKNDWSSVEYYERSLPVYQQANPVQHSVFGGTFASNADGQQVTVLGGAEDEDDDEEEEDRGYDDECGGAEHSASGAVSGVVTEHSNGETGANNEDESSHVASERAPKAKHRSTKNPFKKSDDGWCTVQRKR